MGLIDTVSYVKVAAGPTALSLRVYALSTCGFCERALHFLKDQQLDHEYIFVDNLAPETKRALKDELKAKHGNIPVFPLLVIDGERSVAGFTEDKWREAIGL